MAAAIDSEDSDDDIKDQKDEEDMEALADDQIDPPGVPDDK